MQDHILFVRGLCVPCVPAVGSGHSCEAGPQQHADSGVGVQVDNVAEKLMPPGVRSLRSMLHATAVEVLLYLTPVHCHDMLSSLVEAMNAQFSRFMLRHSDFQVRPFLLGSQQMQPAGALP